MYELIRVQYCFFHTITKEQVLALVPKILTQKQAETIIADGEAK